MQDRAGVNVNTARTRKADWHVAGTRPPADVRQAFLPELLSRPLGIVMPDPELMATWRGLSDGQRGYALHWLRSNRFTDQDLPDGKLEWLFKRAKAQRP